MRDDLIAGAVPAHEPTGKAEEQADDGLEIVIGDGFAEDEARSVVEILDENGIVTENIDFHHRRSGAAL